MNFFCGFVSPEDRGKLAEELKRADAVVLTYACDQPETLNRLSTFWLPELRQLEVFILICICTRIFVLVCSFDGKHVKGKLLQTF